MTFRICLVQFKPERKKVRANVKKLTHLLAGITADLIVLPELSNSGYLYDSTDALLPYSDPQDGSGEFLSSLRGLADQSGGVIVAGYAERDGSHLYNSAAAISSDGVIANYRKTHLFSKEKSLFEPGNSGFLVFDWRQVKIGMMICFDWIFPESARTLALSGAQIIAHPANLILPYCQDAMITRSIENKVFTITANRIDTERLQNKTLYFTGQSQMTAPDGEILYRGPKHKATIHILEINPDDALDKEISKENDLFKDRKTEYYL